MSLKNMACLGVIFSSPRCVHSLEQAIETYGIDPKLKTTIIEKWKDKRIFCIGPSTLCCATKLFSLSGDKELTKCIVSNDGNAKSLGASILSSTNFYDLFYLKENQRFFSRMYKLLCSLQLMNENQ